MIFGMLSDTACKCPVRIELMFCLDNLTKGKYDGGCKGGVEGTKWLEHRIQVKRKKRTDFCMAIQGEGRHEISESFRTPKRNKNVEQRVAKGVSQGQKLFLVLLNKKINGSCPEVR